VGVLGVSALACLGLALVCPFALAGAVLFGAFAAIEAAPLIQAIQKLNDQKDQKARKETELANLKSQKELINKLEATVGLTDTKSEPLTQSLGTFEDVWQNIVTDLTEIETTLELIERVGGDDKKMAHDRINVCMKTYQTLSVAFDAYARLS